MEKTLIFIITRTIILMLKNNLLNLGSSKLMNRFALYIRITKNVSGFNPCVNKV